jgi:hypothetical protein
LCPFWPVELCPWFLPFWYPSCDYSPAHLLRHHIGNLTLLPAVPGSKSILGTMLKIVQFRTVGCSCWCLHACVYFQVDCKNLGTAPVFYFLFPNTPIPTSGLICYCANICWHWEAFNCVVSFFS